MVPDGKQASVQEGRKGGREEGKEGRKEGRKEGMGADKPRSGKKKIRENSEHTPVM